MVQNSAPISTPGPGSAQAGPGPAGSGGSITGAGPASSTILSHEVTKVVSVRAYHIAERLKLKDVREKLQYQATEFSNYEMVVQLEGIFSFMLLYSFGSVVFFNTTDADVEREMGRLKEFRSPFEATRTSDHFLVEISDSLQNKVFFDRVQVRSLTNDSIKIVSLLLAQSTALEYYDILIETLLEQTSKFSRKLQTEGKFLDGSQELIKFIGQCLSTKQEIISYLYVIDAPDEVWENHELERIFLDLKVMLEVDQRFRALEYKIRTIQESIEIIVDLSKSHRATQLEYIIIGLISCEILISLFFQFFIKG